MPQYFFLTLCLLLATAISLRAESPQESIDIHFAIASSDESVSDLYYRNGEDLIPVRLSNTSFSPVYAYTGPPVIEFFLMPKSAKAESLPILAGRASVPINSAEGVYILISSLNRKARPPLNFNVIDKRRHLQGNRRVIVANRYGQPFRFMAGKNVIDLKSGRMRIEEAPQLENGSFRAMVLTIEGGEPTKAYQSYIRIPEHSSVFVFVDADKDSPAHVQVRTLTFYDFEHPGTQVRPPHAENKKRTDDTSLAPNESYEESF